MPTPVAENGGVVWLRDRSFNELCKTNEKVKDLSQRLGGPEDAVAHYVSWNFARNLTGAPLEGCEIVGIGAPTILPSRNLRSFKRNIRFNVVKPTNCRKIALAFKPAPAFRYTCVTNSGIGPVKINVREAHMGDNWDCRADIIPGTCKMIQSSSTGGITVLWTESEGTDGVPTQTGEQWAYVQVGNPTACGASDGTGGEIELCPEIQALDDLDPQATGLDLSSLKVVVSSNLGCGLLPITICNSQ